MVLHANIWVPYLKLTGPTRAVVLVDPVTFEVDLKVKGTTQAEDECLSFLAVRHINFTSLQSKLIENDYASKLSTLEFEIGHIVYSVEATIFVRVRTGSWPSGFRAQIAARTASISIQLLKKQKLEKHSLLNMTRLA